MFTRLWRSWSKQHIWYAMVWAWIVLATVVVIATFNFAYHHPGEFRRRGGPCCYVANSPCSDKP